MGYLHSMVGQDACRLGNRWLILKLLPAGRESLVKLRGGQQDLQHWEPASWSEGPSHRLTRSEPCLAEAVGSSFESRREVAAAFRRGAVPGFLLRLEQKDP